jgi:hypothetical protein
VIDHARPNRIQDDVSAEVQKIRIPLDEYRLETPLKDVPIVSVAPIESLRIHPVQLPHTLRQIGFLGLDDQMIVIVQ